MESRKKSIGPRIGIALLWLLAVLEMLGMGIAGFSKFTSDWWPNSFETWGYPAGFALFIGAAEMLGGVLVLVPRLAAYSAIGLIVIMIGALGTVMTNDTTMGPGMPALHIAILTALLVWRWPIRWIPGSTTQ